MFLLILCNFVIYCFDLIAYRKLANFMTKSTFNPTGADDGSANVCVCVCVCVYIYEVKVKLSCYRPGVAQRVPGS
jgi:hypothetical protein